MITLTKKSAHPCTCDKTLTLPWEQRIKSRLRVVLDDGSEGGIILSRGAVLRDGDCLLSEDGEAVMIRAAKEKLSTIVDHDFLLLAKICYHLGNRHTPLEIKDNRVSYGHDHVLDDMVIGLGGQVTCELAPFEPEYGAYSSSGHGHNHD